VAAAAVRVGLISPWWRRSGEGKGLSWTRDDSYRLYKYACHEGNAVRDWIMALRAQRREEAGAKGK
jgi:hypothetical protein